MKDFWEYVNSIAPGFWPRLGVAVAIFVASWLAGTILKFVLRRAARHLPTGKGRVLRLVASSSKIIVLLFGGITALAMAGVNVAALVAGLGLTGFALGFALKDALSNLLAGALIMVYQPFDCGDVITVAGCRGLVEEINLRYTVLVEEGKTHLVPNSKLYTNNITIEQRGKAKGEKTGTTGES